MDEPKIKKLFSKEDINNRILDISNDIMNNYPSNEEIVIIGLLKGCFIFTADLVRKINRDICVDFMSVSSYGNNLKSSGIINIKTDISIDISNKNVIIIDDIIDTGNTIFEVKKYLELKKPKRIEICCLLDKTDNRKKEIEVKYIGFNCPNKFIVGYGMDAADRYRNLPFIGYI